MNVSYKYKNIWRTILIFEVHFNEFKIFLKFHVKLNIKITSNQHKTLTQNDEWKSINIKNLYAVDWQSIALNHLITFFSAPHKLKSLYRTKFSSNSFIIEKLWNKLKSLPVTRFTLNSSTIYVPLFKEKLWNPWF